MGFIIYIYYKKMKFMWSTCSAELARWRPTRAVRCCLVVAFAALAGSGHVYDQHKSFALLRHSPKTTNDEKAQAHAHGSNRFETSYSLLVPTVILTWAWYGNDPGVDTSSE